VKLAKNQPGDEAMLPLDTATTKRFSFSFLVTHELF